MPSWLQASGSTLNWLAHIVLAGGAAYVGTNPKIAPFVAPVITAVAGQLPPVIGPGVQK